MSDVPKSWNEALMKDDLNAIANSRGYGTGKAFRDRVAEDLEHLSALPARAWMCPVKAHSGTPDDWMICSFGNSGEDHEDWYLVTDTVRASNLADAEFPSDAKLDAIAIAAVLNAYRLGLLVRADGK